MGARGRGCGGGTALFLGGRPRLRFFVGAAAGAAAVASACAAAGAVPLVERPCDDTRPMRKLSVITCEVDLIWMGASALTRRGIGRVAAAPPPPSRADANGEALVSRAVKEKLADDGGAAAKAAASAAVGVPPPGRGRPIFQPRRGAASAAAAAAGARVMVASV